MKKILLLLLLFTVSGRLWAQVSVLNQGFETWPPTGWNNYTLGAGIGWIQSWQSPAEAAHTGDHGAYPAINNGLCNNWLVSPPIVVSTPTYVFQYWERFDAVQYYNQSTVHISTGSGNPTGGDFQVLFPQPDTSTTWVQRNLSLGAYVGDTIYVAFQYVGTWHTWFVDDVFVGPNNFTDGNLSRLVNPIGPVTTTSTENILVSLVNQGSNPIDSVSISWEVNGQSQAPFSSQTLNLLPGDSVNLTLGSYAFNNPGSYTIQAVLALNNDFVSQNDTLVRTYGITTLKDAQLNGISPEAYTPETGLQDVRVLLENKGATIIDTVQVAWQVNGLAQPTFSTTALNLVPGANTILTIGQYSFPKGVHDIFARVIALGDTSGQNNEYQSYAAVDTFWESFEGRMFPPDGWSLDFGTRDDINFDFPPHGNYYYASQPDSNFFGAVSDTLFTPLLDIAPGDQLHMRVKASAFLAGNHSVVWKNGTTGAIQVLQTFSTIPEAWDPVSIDLSAAAGINYIGIVTQQNGPALTKYDLFTSDAQRHFRNFDLAIGEEDIYFLARKGQSTSFPLTVKNQTAQLVSGGSYTVKLMEAPGVLLATVNGVALGPWEEVNLSLSHTYNALAAHDLYFEIDYGQDEDLTNNQSWQTEVHVVPATVILNDIGQPDFQNLNFPFNGNGNTNSLGEDDLSQSLYYSQEFAAEGNLYGMIYTYDNALNNDAIKHLPLKVWVAQTQAADLSGGWIPNNQLTLVFDDTLEILPGTGREVYIPFDNPLVYTGIENLVVQDYVYDPEWPPAILSFYAADQPFGGAVRTISVNDVYALDPLNPPAGFFQSEDHVYTTFVLEPVVDTGLISGTVYSTNNVALGNVEIAVQGTSLADSTDMNGQYALPYLPYGSYTLKASYPGYNDTIVVVQLDTAALLLDLYLRERTQVSITGTVSGSNDPGTPLEFVSVLAEGYTVDSAMTDASGQFSLANIFGVSLYSVQLQRQGYYDTTLTVQVTDSNINLGNVVMRQEFLSPFEVAAVNQGTAAYVVWRSPLEIAKVKLQNDLGVCSFSYTNSPSENVWLGNRFAISGPTTLTSVEIHTDIYELDSDFVRMDVFDATTEEILASSAPFLIYNDTVMVIGIPNIVVFEDIFVMLHWENNVNSTHALCVDFSDPNVPNTALVKYPGQPAELFSTFLGQGAPNLSFLVRVNTLQAGTTVGVAQPLTYNLYRGLADEFPDTQNWTQVNAAPVAGLTFLDSTWTSQEVSGEYRYAVETIYPEGNSALTFSNPILWTMFTLIEDLAELQVQVYPNPATDFLIVELETKLISRAHLRLLDVRGRLVDEVYVPSFSKTIRLKRDVSQLAQGIYFVQIETEDHQVLTQRIVIR